MGQAGIVCHGIGKLAPLRCIEEVRNIGWCLYSKRTVELNKWLTLLTALGSDDNHTIGCTGTVDGCGSTILQNFDRLDIIRVEGGKTVVTESAIDDIERFCCTKRSSTTDYDIYIGSGNTCLLDDFNTRGATLEG